MERIKAYFEEQIKTDEALKAVYDESKLDKCWGYIVSQARKLATSNCAMVEDAVVYKWARDYMLGDVETPAEKEVPPEPVQEETPATEKIETVVDEPEETVEPEEEPIEEVPQVEEKPAEEKKEDKPEPVQQFLFDF